MNAPSATQSKNGQTKRLVAANFGANRVSGTTLHKQLSGAVKIQNFSWSPGSGRQRLTNPTSFKADEASITEDAERIDGNGAVRFSVGNFTLESESFKFLTGSGLLLLTKAVLRSRNPLLRLSAHRIRVQTKVIDDGSLTIESIELVGEVEGQLVLPWRNEAKKFQLSATRFLLCVMNDEMNFRIEGGKTPARAVSRDGEFELVVQRATAKYGPRGLEMAGDLSGQASISGAGFLNPKDRVTVQLTEAEGFVLRASQNQPTWWNGIADRTCSFNPLEISKPKCGDVVLGDKLVLYDPGYGKSKTPFHPET